MNQDTITPEWSAAVREVLKSAEGIIDSIAKLSRLSDANELGALVEAAASGEFVGQSRMTKERVEEILAMFDSFATWMVEPLPTGRPPVMVICRRDP